MKTAILCAIAFLGAFMLVQAYSEKPSTDEAEIINAYTYGFPLVLMDVTKDVLTDTPTLTDTKAPINQILNKRTFPNPSFTEVVSPNADTLYSQAWIDVSQEPMILVVPDMGKRYYLFPLLDQWTNVFFSPGTRTTGNGKGAFAITGPKWRGSLPDGVKEVKAPTDIVWLIGRIQTNGASDFAAVNKLQDEFKLIPLSAWGTNYKPPERVPFNPNLDTKKSPIKQVLTMDGVAFFNKLADILKKTPIPAQDAEYVKQFSTFGFIPGQSFDVSKLSSEQIATLNKAVKLAQIKIKRDWEEHPFATTENGWGVIRKGIGNYGTNYAVRAAVAFGGLGANLPEDAIYPATSVDSNGQPLNGKFRYVVHFDKGGLPPVNAFWSITMYDEHQFFVPNPINRYAIGDRDKLQFNRDGSLDIYIQNTPPNKDQESNWLPAPNDNFNLLLRLYSPSKEIINGTWKPPAVRKISN